MRVTDHAPKASIIPGLCTCGVIIADHGYDAPKVSPIRVEPTATQTAQILALLRDRGDDGLTAMDALREAQCFRLAARISDLKDEGYDITSTIETTDTGKRIARYRLVREAA